MRFLTTAVALLTLASSVLSQALTLNTSTAYYLHTQLKSNQTGKEKFDNLWLVASHTGAGLNDAVLYSNKSYAIKGFTNATNITTQDGGFYQHQEFDLGNTWPYGLSVSNVNFYAAWEPVRINVGYGDEAFTFNSTGLQWTSQPEYPEAQSFGGWLVCDWWHGKPQLFAKLRYKVSLLNLAIILTNCSQLLRL